MFTLAFEKVSVVGGAIIGAIGGGEHSPEGGKKNRVIGALRGAAAEAGMTLGGYAGLLATKKGRAFLKAKRGGDHMEMLEKMLDMRKRDHFVSHAASAASGYGGYKAMKHFGPKYDKDK